MQIFHSQGVLSKDDGACSTCIDCFRESLLCWDEGIHHGAVALLCLGVALQRLDGYSKGPGPVSA